MLRETLSLSILEQWLSRWSPLLIFLLTLLVYANSFPAAFIQDDIHIVQNNPLVQSFDLFRIFTTDYWYGIENSGLYRPLTILSLALNRVITGPAPWGFHLFNLLLHSVAALLLWYTLPRWGVPIIAAFIAAVVFAVHPIHTEVVNEVVGRSELLVACLLLLALNAASREGRLAGGTVCGCYLLALFAKEHAIVLLAILPLFDAFVFGTRNVWRKRWFLYAGMLGITGVWGLIRLWGVQHNGPLALYSSTVAPLAYLPWSERVPTALQYQGLYLAKLFVPLKLQAAYSQADLPPVLSSFLSPLGVAVFLVSFGVLVMVIRGWRERQWWSLFAASYLVSFAPTSNVLLPIGVTLAERLAYFPSVWFSAGVGIVIHHCTQRESLRMFAGVAVTGVLIFYCLATGMRNRDFESELRLWSAEVSSNPADFLGWQSLAEVLSGNRRYVEAERAYQRLLQLQPDFQGALRSYVAFLVGQNRFSEALEPARRSLSLSERGQDVVGMGYDLINLAEILIGLREYDQALAVLHRPESRHMERMDFYYNFLGSAYEGKGETVLAAKAYRQATELDPHNRRYRANLQRMEDRIIGAEELP